MTALAPAVAGPFEAYPSLIGGMGPPDQDARPREEGIAEPSRGSREAERLLRLVCPKDSPVVTQVQVESEQEVTVGWYKPNPSVNGITLYCSLVDRPQGRHVQAAEWLGPLKIRTGSFAGLMDPQRKTAYREKITCPDPLVAVGISGLTRERLFSVGLICGEPTLAQGATVRPQGRVKLSAEAVANRRPLPICDAARGARARNSPAAPGLEARCKAEGEQPPIDFDGLAIKGEAIASQDPCLSSSATSSRKVPFGWDSISGWRSRKVTPRRARVSRQFRTDSVQPSRADLPSLWHSPWIATGTRTSRGRERPLRRQIPPSRRPVARNPMFFIDWDSISRRGFLVTLRSAQRATPPRGPVPWESETRSALLPRVDSTTRWRFTCVGNRRMKPGVFDLDLASNAQKARARNANMPGLEAQSRAAG